MSNTGPADEAEGRFLGHMDDLMDEVVKITAFSTELDAYVAHLKDLGYPSSEITVMIIGFGAGWDAQRGDRSAL